MPIPSYRNSKPMCLLSTALFALSGALGLAQSHQCRTPAVIPLTTSEPPAKIFIDPPLPGPLPRGEWQLSNIVPRTCTLRLCSDRVLCPHHPVSDTFM